jgi:PAS domain-containing protein
MAALAGGKANPFGHVAGNELLGQGSQQVIPAASTSNLAAPTDSANTNANAGNVTSSPVATTMKPPPPPSQKSVQSTLSTAGIPGMLGQTPPKIAPMPGSKPLANTEGAAASSFATTLDDKKQQKRAANRRSAQLSRKRKKQYIEELKEENDELRRKEQILRSIPDLIVVFDSSGKLGFVSPSVSRFIDMSPDELLGTSFWDRLCESIVRLLKSAVMDALAAKKSNSDTCPLGSGVWDLRLVDKDSSYTLVSLNGVVHFSGEAPECVCCIRPLDQHPMQKITKEVKKLPAARPVSSCDGSRSSDSSARDALEIRANPNQSVISSDTTSADDSGTNSESNRKKPRREEVGRGADGESVRISDGDSVSGSGSDDGIASN